MKNFDDYMKTWIGIKLNQVILHTHIVYCVTRNSTTENIKNILLLKIEVMMVWFVAGALKQKLDIA